MPSMDDLRARAVDDSEVMARLKAAARSRLIAAASPDIEAVTLSFASEQGKLSVFYHFAGTPMTVPYSLMNDLTHHIAGDVPEVKDATGHVNFKGEELLWAREWPTTAYDRSTDALGAA